MSIGQILAMSGQNIGSQIGSGYAGLGRDVQGMLTGIGGNIRQKRNQREAMKMLEQFKDDPQGLARMAQQYGIQGNTQLATVFQNAAQAATGRQDKNRQAIAGRGTGELLALASDPSFNINDPKQRSGYLGMADAFGVSRGDAMKIALEQRQKRTEGGGSFRQEIYDAESNTMRQVNFLTDASGRVIDKQVLGASAGPEKPTITVKEKEGIFYTFEDGKPVGEYESKAAAEAAAREQNKANEAILKAQRVKLSISDALGMIERNENVGGWKQLLKYLPDTEARRFENYLTSIKANVGFDQLLQIKDAGSTLGQVSNIENLLLQSTIDSLDGLQSKEDLVQALNKIDAYYTALITKAKFGPDVPLEKWAGSVDWMQPEFARMYEQQGGEVLINESEGTILVISPNGESIKLMR